MVPHLVGGNVPGLLHPSGAPSSPKLPQGWAVTWHWVGCVVTEQGSLPQGVVGRGPILQRSAVSLVRHPLSSPLLLSSGFGCQRREAGGARLGVEGAESQAKAFGLGCYRDNHSNDTLDVCHALQFH